MVPRPKAKTKVKVKAKTKIKATPKPKTKVKVKAKTKVKPKTSQRGQWTNAEAKAYFESFGVKDLLRNWKRRFISYLKDLD